jgi:hypothetical protein
MRPQLILIFESKPATNFSTLNPKEQDKMGCPFLGSPFLNSANSVPVLLMRYFRLMSID